MIIGLTGGIATGKSTARQLLAVHCQMEVFDADACVHGLLDTNSGVIEGIRALFGAAFIGSDGKPDRGALRETVFRNPEARRKLEVLLHRLVRAEWQAGSERASAEGRNYLSDIPLLYEVGAESFFDAVVVVACSRVTQLGRLQHRGISEETANAMLATQLPLGQKMAAANFVIWNEGSLAALGRQTELLSKQLFPV